MPSEYFRTGRPSIPARPTCSSASSIRRRRVRRPPARPAASISARLARPDRCPYADGPSTSAPTFGSTSRTRDGIGLPRTSISPLVANTRPSSMRITVVFPDPFGPRKPYLSPSRTSRSTWSTASTGPNRFVSPLVTITGESPIPPSPPEAARCSTAGVTGPASRNTGPPKLELARATVSNGVRITTAVPSWNSTCSAPAARAALRACAPTRPGSGTTTNRENPVPYAAIDVIPPRIWVRANPASRPGSGGPIPDRISATSGSSAVVTPTPGAGFGLTAGRRRGGSR